jgi:hypothetical protein
MSRRDGQILLTGFSSEINAGCEKLGGIMNPKVFISHASEDKPGFVLDFATKLRAKGIDAWLDRWEMLPGDSLVDKIFEEGIKNASALIVVLSANSVNKPWVREEINAAFVKRISSNCKLIPVIIDDCDVPECLSSTLWERIKDCKNYSTELDRIVSSVLNHREKPALGAVPKHVTTAIDKLAGLTTIDTVIFKFSCDLCLNEQYPNVSLNKILPYLEDHEISPHQIQESLEILDGRGFIKATRVVGGIIPQFAITLFGFDKYVKQYVDDYDQLVERVSYGIANSSQSNNYQLADELEQPLRLITHIFQVLESRNLINMSKTRGGMFVHRVSPELKRLLR